MTAGVASWDRFVGDGLRDAAAIDDGIGAIAPDPSAVAEHRDEMLDLAHRAFRLATGALLLGAEDVGRLALACERGIDMVRSGVLAAEHAMPVLASSVHTLRQAFLTLANPDESGARTHQMPLEAARFELETLFPQPGRPTRASADSAPDVPVSSLTRRPATQFDGESETESEPEHDTSVDEDERTWVPTVDDDMIELFFEEANERIEELSVKLLEIEQRPDDIELLRDIFRDLHTVKGSSAMVALTPMNKLAHAAEDLVGQLREGDRSADGGVVDALLAALDGLREVLAYARAGVRIDTDFEPIVRRLRDPSAPVQDTPPADDDEDSDDSDSAIAPAVRGEAAHGKSPAAKGAPVEPTAPRASKAARQTIRVDFDKLDRLMNLVGELLLGRDGLHNGIQSLGAVAGELSSDRHLTRRLLAARRATGQPSSSVSASGRDKLRSSLGDLGDEIGRVERVLVDISQDLGYATGRLDSVSDELRDQVMKLRMVPVGGVFRKHLRTVRDLGNQMGKRVKLELVGEDTELDKLLVEALDEPLMHLVRNSVDHGIEMPDDRLAAGKSVEGTVRLSAMHRGNQMVIQISDDGKGIDADVLRKRAEERNLLTPEELETFDDRQILDVIFRPGFSTAAKVSAVSGRGVGMDVVRQTIVSRLKGIIDIDSVPGKGSTFTLRLPLTLAIIQVLLARAGGELFAIPLDSVIRTFTCDPNKVQLVQDREMIAVGDRQVPLIRLARVLELGAHRYGTRETLQVVLTQIGKDHYGLVCDHLLGKKEIVIKSLGDILESVPCAAGATLLGDRCAIILDIPAIIGRSIRGGGQIVAAPIAGTKDKDRDPEIAEDALKVLLVEDSDIVREALRRLLIDAGYNVTTAVDGVEGLEQARKQQFDLVSTDVMMPRMDGYELTRALRATAEYKDTPIVMVTSRGERIDRVRGFDSGVDEYITKPHDRQLLVRVVRKLLSESEGER